MESDNPFILPDNNLVITFYVYEYIYNSTSAFKTNKRDSCVDTMYSPEKKNGFKFHASRTKLRCKQKHNYFTTITKIIDITSAYKWKKSHSLRSFKNVLFNVFKMVLYFHCWTMRQFSSHSRMNHGQQVFRQLSKPHSQRLIHKTRLSACYWGNFELIFAASQQRTLTPPDTWSCPIWDLHLF